MSLTLWHRQFRNQIFLVLWTCYSEVQLVTSAAVSLLGALCAAWTFASSMMTRCSLDYPARYLQHSFTAQHFHEPVNTDGMSLCLLFTFFEPLTPGDLPGSYAVAIWGSLFVISTVHCLNIPCLNSTDLLKSKKSGVLIVRIRSTHAAKSIDHDANKFFSSEPSRRRRRDHARTCLHR